MITSHASAQAFFDQTADDYQRRSDGRVHNFSSMVFQRRFDTVAAVLGSVPPGSVVLDYGMGPAVYGPACVARQLQYLGIDISPVMVERARELHLPGATYAVGDLESLSPYRNGADAVLAIGLLDYLEDPSGGLEALAACVRPSGQLVVSFRNRYSLPRILRDGLKVMWRGLVPAALRPASRAFCSPIHEHSFDWRHDLMPALRRLGFEAVDVRFFNCSPIFWNFPLPRWMWKVWRAVDARLASPRTRAMCSGGILVVRRTEP
jgi:SAM-dependent methyltransferase